MKPLPVAPLTPLDDRIMQGIRARWRYPLNHWYQFYDREDATLMLRAQYQRQWLPASGSVPALPPWLLPFEWACGPVGGQL